VKEKIETTKSVKNNLKQYLRKKTVEVSTSEIENNLVGISAENPEVLEQLEKSLEARKDAYESTRHRKFYVLTFGLLLGIVVGYAVPWLVNRLGHATYQRVQLE